jgi:hypothetical protein
MADTGWISCASYAQRASTGDIAWSPTSGTTELASSDNSRIQTASGLTNNSATNSTNQMLCAFGTGIADNVPSDATIDGVEVSVEGYYSAQANNTNFALHSDSSGTLVSGTAVQVSNLNDWGNGSASNEKYVTVGGAANLWGAGSIAASAIRASGLRLALYVSTFLSVGPSILYLDHVRIKVHYTYAPLTQQPVALFWSAP